MSEVTVKLVVYIHFSPMAGLQGEFVVANYSSAADLRKAVEAAKLSGNALKVMQNGTDTSYLYPAALDLILWVGEAMPRPQIATAQGMPSGMFGN